MRTADRARAGRRYQTSARFRRIVDSILDAMRTGAVTAEDVRLGVDFGLHLRAMELHDREIRADLTREILERDP